MRFGWNYNESQTRRRYYLNDMKLTLVKDPGYLVDNLLKFHSHIDVFVNKVCGVAYLNQLLGCNVNQS